MAGDWIKARGELRTHPRFLALCSNLIYGESPGLLIYTSGEDALGIGVFPPSNETVTERALRCVTEPALRDVTHSRLLALWCAVNSHCKVRETDAVMSPMVVADVDGIVGVDGFGDALVRVGWMYADEEANELIFPNFLEFNEPACLRRPPPKSNAERQRDFRQKRPKPPRNETVTKSNDKRREDKRREETKKKRLSGAAAPAPVETWLTPLLTAWQEELGGKPPNGQLARYCRPLVDTHGTDATVAQLRAYLRLHTGDRATYLDLSKFAGAFGQWGHAAGSVVSAAEEARIESVLSLVRRKDVHP